MSTRRQYWFLRINAALLISATIFLIPLSLKGPLYDERTKEFRDDRLEYWTPEALKKKVMAANEYIVAQEELLRNFHLLTLAVCVAAAAASVVNLVLVQKKGSDCVEKV